MVAQLKIGCPVLSDTRVCLLDASSRLAMDRNASSCIDMFYQSKNNRETVENRKAKNVRTHVIGPRDVKLFIFKIRLLSCGIPVTATQ